MSSGFWTTRSLDWNPLWKKRTISIWQNITKKVFSDQRKKRWYIAESIVLQSYIDQWWTLVQKNFTVPGGEIDLIVWKENNNSEESEQLLQWSWSAQKDRWVLCFIEVKDVSRIDDLSGYITAKKRQTIKKTMQLFLHKLNNWTLNREHTSLSAIKLPFRTRCDVVFVKHGKIYLAVEDCVEF